MSRSLGNRVLQSLFNEPPKVIELTPLRKGPNEELTERRKTAIAARVYYYAYVLKLNPVTAKERAGQDMFLTETTIGKVAIEMSQVIRDMVTKNYQPADLRKQWPQFVWP